MVDDFTKRGTPVAVMLATVDRRAPAVAGWRDTPQAPTLAEFIAQVENQARGGGGRVLRRIGNGVLAVFDTAEMAVLAAVAIQRDMETTASSGRGRDISVRIGICRGRMKVDGRDIFEDDLGQAARLVGFAGAGEVFLTRTAQRALSDEFQRMTRLIRDDFGSEATMEFVWRQDDVTVRPLSFKRGEVLTLEVRFGGQTFIVGAERQHLTIGRGADNDLVIDQTFASRHHAEITARENKFFLRDRSTNGTFVSPDSGETFPVRREEFTLTGSGRLFIGSEATDPLRYRVQTPF